MGDNTSYILTCSTDKISGCCGSHHTSARLYTCTSCLSPSGLLAWRKPCRSSSRPRRSACGPQPSPRTHGRRQQAGEDPVLHCFTVILLIWFYWSHIDCFIVCSYSCILNIIVQYLWFQFLPHLLLVKYRLTILKQSHSQSKLNDNKCMFSQLGPTSGLRNIKKNASSQNINNQTKLLSRINTSVFSHPVKICFLSMKDSGPLFPIFSLNSAANSSFITWKKNHLVCRLWLDRSRSIKRSYNK